MLDTAALISSRRICECRRRALATSAMSVMAMESGSTPRDAAMAAIMALLKA